MTKQSRFALSASLHFNPSFSRDFFFYVPGVTDAVHIQYQAYSLSIYKLFKQGHMAYAALWNQSLMYCVVVMESVINVLRVLRISPL